MDDDECNVEVGLQTDTTDPGHTPESSPQKDDDPNTSDEDTTPIESTCNETTCKADHRDKPFDLIGSLWLITRIVGCIVFAISAWGGSHLAWELVWSLLCGFTSAITHAGRWLCRGATLGITLLYQLYLCAHTCMNSIADIVMSESDSTVTSHPINGERSIPYDELSDQYPSPQTDSTIGSGAFESNLFIEQLRSLSQFACREALNRLYGNRIWHMLAGPGVLTISGYTLARTLRPTLRG